jgi:RsiW-degrading membrane proteinase PrsW (M82 family)
MDLELIVVALAPIVFLAWFVYTRDKYEREPRKLIVKTFLLGAILVVPVIVAELLGSLFIPPSNDPVGLFLHFLLVVALVEESSKYLAVRVSVYGSREFNEPMDGLVYGAIAGLGFAAPENLLYVLMRGAALGVIRGVLSVPGHALWGSMIGYYLARQKFTGPGKSGLVGLSAAVILHTIFDYGLVWMDPLAGIMTASGVVVVGWIIFFRFTRTAHAASPFRPEAHAIRLSGAPTKYCTNCGALILAGDRFCRSCGAGQFDETLQHLT